MFTVNDARCTNQLETVNKKRIKQYHQNGFTRTSLSATVTRVSNFVEDNVFLFYIVKAPHLGTFSHSLPNTSNTSIAMHSACSKLSIDVLRFNLYHVEGRFKLLNFNIDNFFLTVNNSTFVFEGIQSCAQNVACMLSSISNRPCSAFLTYQRIRY